MIDKLRQFGEVLAGIDRGLGFRKFVQYTLVAGLLILLAPVMVDPRGSIKSTVSFFINISEEIESDRMVERDLAIKEVYPVLRELRAALWADRVVYYEYHNSIQNEAGVPFKFVDLVYEVHGPGLPDLPSRNNLNASRFSELYTELQKSGIVMNRGDRAFGYKYPGTSILTSGSGRQAFINVVGDQNPLGLLIIEWNDDLTPIDWSTVDRLGLRDAMRVNALMYHVKHIH